MSLRARAAACEAAILSRSRDRARCGPAQRDSLICGSRCVHAGSSDRSVRRSPPCRLSEHVRRRITPRRNRFVAEGRLVVGRLLEAGHRVESLLVNDASYRALEASLSRLPQDVPVYVCDTDEFTAITGFNLHRGCLALAERPIDRSPDDVVRQANLLPFSKGSPIQTTSAARSATPRHSARAWS